MDTEFTTDKVYVVSFVLNLNKAAGYTIVINILQIMGAIAVTLFSILSGGHAVRRAAAFDNGQLRTVHGASDSRFFAENKRTNKIQILAGKVALRGKAADLSAVEQVHQKGLYGIVKMMTERDLLAAGFFCHVVQNAAAHPRTKAAGIFFLPVLEDDLSEVGTANAVFDVPFPAQRLDLAVIGLHTVEAGVSRQSDDLVFPGIISSHHRECIEKIHGILAAGNAYGDAVAFIDHIIFFRCGANMTHQILHSLPCL